MGKAERTAPIRPSSFSARNTTILGKEGSLVIVSRNKGLSPSSGNTDGERN